MTVVFFFDSFMVAVFLLFALGLGYQAYLALHGTVFILTIIFFAAITILTVLSLINKAKESARCAQSKSLTAWNIFMSTVSSAIGLYICHLFMQDLRIYDDGLWGMIGFIIGLFVGGALWLFTVAGWIEALDTAYPASFNYKGFLKELIAAGIFYALVNF